MTDSEILVERSGSTAILVLNRPGKANALTMTGAECLIEEVTRLGVDPAVDAILLTAAGKFFSGGMDLTKPPGADLRELSVVQARLFKRLLFALLEFPKPFVVAMNGPAIGAGCMLALLADRLVSVGETYMSVPEIDLGVPSPVAFAIAKDALGQRWAADMTLAGRRVFIEELSRSMPVEITEVAGLRAAGLAAAQFLGGKPLLTYDLNKRFIRRALHAELTDAFVAVDAFRAIRFPEAKGGDPSQ